MKIMVILAISVGVFLFAGRAEASCWKCGSWTSYYDPATGEEVWLRLCDEVTGCCQQARNLCSDYPISCELSGNFCMWARADEPSGSRNPLIFTPSREAVNVG
jgi:hypothetical protein